MKGTVRQHINKLLFTQGTSPLAWTLTGYAYLSVEPQLLMKSVDFSNRQRLKVGYWNYLRYNFIILKWRSQRHCHNLWLLLVFNYLSLSETLRRLTKAQQLDCFEVTRWQLDTSQWAAHYCCFYSSFYICVKFTSSHFFASRTLSVTGYSISLSNGWHSLQTTVQARIEAFSRRKIIIHYCWRQHISSTKTSAFWRCLTKSWSEEWVHRKISLWQMC